jgi:hypothetical protein
MTGARIFPVWANAMTKGSKFRLCDVIHAPGDWLISSMTSATAGSTKSWSQKILLAAEAPSAACLAGAQARPPEECGSVPGYENLVEAMANSKHSERAELLEWLGEPFNPEAFSIPNLNRTLKRLKLRPFPWDRCDRHQLRTMKPEPQETQKDAGKDLETFSQLPAITKKLLMLKDRAENATGPEALALNKTIRDESKEMDQRGLKG